MRLLYICGDFGISPAGTKGASVHLRAITRALCEAGHEVVLLSPRPGPGRGHPARRLFRAAASPAEGWAERVRTWLKQRDLPRDLSSDLRPLLFNAWAADRSLRALEKNPPDAIIERLSLLNHLGVDLADAFGCPLCVEVNALMTQEAERFRSLALADLARQIEQRVLQRADAVAAVSMPLADMLVDRGVKASKVHVVPNGADVDAFRPGISGRSVRERHGLTGRFVIGYTGSLKIWHGVDILLAAFARLRESCPDATLLIVGSGPTEAELRALAERFGAGRAIVFTGAVEHGQMPEYLAAMDVAVAPYRNLEEFYFSPIKLFEYMAAGRCIVASRLGQISDLIEHERNGLLCPPDDAKALAGLLRLSMDDELLRGRLGRAARHSIEERYTWKRAAGSISDLIEDCLVVKRLEEAAAGLA